MAASTPWYAHGVQAIPQARRILPGAINDALAHRPTLLPAAPERVATSDRWSLRVELKDDEIARLYAQGLTRGALVWRAGMPEWRPLLITPELSRLLHSTPIALRHVSDATLDDEVTLPRPARVPSELASTSPIVGAANRAPDDGKEAPTVAPTALDVPPTSASPNRRRGELAFVALLSFSAAWFFRSSDQEQVAPHAMAAAAPAPAPFPGPPRPQAQTPSLLAASGIPIVSLSDLPLLGQGASVTRASFSMPRRSQSRTSTSAASESSASGGPTRAQLMAALNQVASVASGCGERSGPVRVVIAFAPSGVARSIQVSGKELPSSVRSCIIGAASRARVASFSGDPVTVSKTL